jgi:TPR repeat protein
MNSFFLYLLLTLSLLITGCGQKSSGEKTENKVTSTKEKKPTAEEKFFLIKKNAEAGDASAQWNLAVLYGNGEGVSKDFNQALDWLKKAAANGNPSAQFKLGELYAKGEGVPKDVTSAVQWYDKAAQGYAPFKMDIWFIYHHGINVPKDETKAMKLLQEIAANGNPADQSLLALEYWHGESESRNLLLAYAWSNLAANRGDKAAIAERDKLKLELTASQIEKAQNLSSHWKKGDILQIASNTNVAIPPSLSIRKPAKASVEKIADASSKDYQQEDEAHKHCPNDIVVWLNLSSGVVHYKGQHWYGRTNTGAYVCKNELGKIKK